MQLIEEAKSDLTYIQEPYTNNNKIVGIPKRFRTYTCGNGRNRAAVVANNKELDIILLNQMSDEDCVVVEVRTNKIKFFATSMYCDATIDMETNIKKMESILRYVHGKGMGLLISTDSNARSTMWFDTFTNQRGRKMEDFLITHDLHLINIDNGVPTFETNRGRSRVDLTLATGSLSRYINKWTIGEQESCSDHKLISYTIQSPVANDTHLNDAQWTGTRYVVREEDFQTFDLKLKENMEIQFKGKTNITNISFV